MLRSNSVSFWINLIYPVVTISNASVFGSYALAQIIPDNTLGSESSTVRSRVIDGVSNDLIDGGAIRGNNLFHSFQEFNVNEGESAYFSNPTSVQSIFSRVTGSNASQIFGKLGVLGKANLFLVNPNGIIFGSNATLDTKGSFIGTTAQSINFADSSQFSASSSPGNTVLLTISVPTELQFGSRPKDITVLGNGQGTTLSPEQVDNTSELRVQQNQTLALIGGNLLIQGGTLKTAGGQIELGSINSPSSVGLEANLEGFSFNYKEVPDFGDVQLLLQATVDASGAGGGRINLQGRNILISDGSVIASATLQAEKGETLSINSSETLKITRVAVERGIESGLYTSVEPGATGTGGNIDIISKNIIVDEGGQIFSGTFGVGTAGSINIKAQNSISLNGRASQIEKQRTGSSISTIVLPNAVGNGGDITLETQHLELQQGAAISSATLGLGKGGDLTIKAKSVDVISTLPSGTPSSLSARATTSGNSGNLIINTDQLAVKDRARVTVSSTGNGEAGNLNITARSTQLDLSGKILAQSTSNQGGNITLQLQDSLELRRNSEISTTAGSNGNGGNINVNTGTLTALENSDITARSFGGRGGNIQITTQGLFLSPDSEINADSERGIDGVTNIQTLGFDVKNSLTPLENNFVTSEQVVAGSCLARRNASQSSFVVTGSGGLPVNPYSEIQEWENLSDSPIDKAQLEQLTRTDARRSQAIAVSNENNIFPKKWKLGDPIVEAQGIIRLPNGRVILGMASQEPASAQSLICRS